MKLDHISYVTQHDQLADTVQRLGSSMGSTFVDGGVHPRFGTRNFTAALKNGQYVEVVCPLNHPASEMTPWGKAVARKAEEGGGWFTWVFSSNDLSPIETKFGRSAIEGHRIRPDNTELKWKQIGVKELMDFRQLPFFIQWLSSDHPSQEGTPHSEIVRIVIADEEQLANSWFTEEIMAGLGQIEIEWVDPALNYDETGIVSVQIATPKGLINLD